MAVADILRSMVRIRLARFFSIHQYEEYKVKESRHSGVHELAIAQLVERRTVVASI